MPAPILHPRLCVSPHQGEAGFDFAVALAVDDLDVNTLVFDAVAELKTEGAVSPAQNNLAGEWIITMTAWVSIKSALARAGCDVRIPMDLAAEEFTMFLKKHA